MIAPLALRARGSRRFIGSRLHNAGAFCAVEAFDAARLRARVALARWLSFPRFSSNVGVGLVHTWLPFAPRRFGGAAPPVRVDVSDIVDGLWGAR